MRYFLKFKPERQLGIVLINKFLACDTLPITLQTLLKRSNVLTDDLKSIQQLSNYLHPVKQVFNHIYAHFFFPVLTNSMIPHMA